jgi:hypothetical protein
LPSAEQFCLGRVVLIRSPDSIKLFVHWFIARNQRINSIRRRRFKWKKEFVALQSTEGTTFYTSDMESCDILRLSLQNVDSRKVPHVRFERSKNAKECEKELADASVSECTYFLRWL